jgi:hypothetical protein
LITQKGSPVSDESAEPIARVIADLRGSRFRPTVTDRDLTEALWKTTRRGPVVDVSTLFREKIIDRGHSIAVYEDHRCILPAWLEAQFAWENTFGNVYVVSHAAVPADEINSSQWETAEPIDWNDVAWIYDWALWCGGRSAGGPISTYGPIYFWQIAISKTGEPLDIHWMDLLAADSPEASRRLTEQGLYDNALLTVLQSFNFLNCRNVELVEPKRERHVRRRLERTGVRIHTINVFPAGRTVRRDANGEAVGGTPLASVRGHFASYGPEYDRGLLFGKYAGRFWISAHVRGASENGVSIADYKLRSETA